MKLIDLLIDQGLIVQLNLGEQKIEFFSNVIGKTETSVYLSPYHRNGNALELNVSPSKGVVCNLFTDDPTTKQRISWKNVELSTITKNEEMMYCVKTSSFNIDSKQDDRRLHERVTIQTKGQIFSGKSTTDGTNVLVHDISDVGISCYAPTSYSPQTSQVLISFTDSIDDNIFNLKVEGSVARVEKKAGNTFVACKVSSGNKEYQMYCFLKRLKERNKLKENEKPASITEQ